MYAIVCSNQLRRYHLWWIGSAFNFRDRENSIRDYFFFSFIWNLRNLSRNIYKSSFYISDEQMKGQH